jgi:hypothetical protein
MEPTNKSTSSLRQRFVAAMMCQTCRRYRRGLFMVVLIALALWVSGRWALLGG